MSTLLIPNVHTRIAYLEKQDRHPYGIAGFVGAAPKGPIDAPQLLKKWKEFQEIFGAFVPYSFLSYSVHGFFNNGGTECYVVRSLSEEAVAAEAVYEDNLGSSFKVKAIDAGSWGHEIRVYRKPATSDNLLLTTLWNNAKARDTYVEVQSAIDIRRRERITVGVEGQHQVRQKCRVKGIDGKRLILSERLRYDFRSGSSVYGSGFRLEVRYRKRVEVFDNLSFNPAHARHFYHIINGPEQERQYLNKAIAGHSMLVQVEMSNIDLPDEGVENRKKGSCIKLRGGRDGAPNAWKIFSTTRGRESMKLIAKEEGENGNRISATVINPTTSFLAREALSADKKVLLRETIDLVPSDKITIIPYIGACDIYTVKKTEQVKYLDQVIVQKPFTNLPEYRKTELLHNARAGEKKLSASFSDEFCVGEKVIVTAIERKLPSYEFEIESIRSEKDHQVFVVHPPLPADLPRGSLVEGPSFRAGSTVRVAIHTFLKSACATGERSLRVESASNFTPAERLKIEHQGIPDDGLEILQVLQGSETAIVKLAVPLPCALPAGTILESTAQVYLAEDVEEGGQHLVVDSAYNLTPGKCGVIIANAHNGNATTLQQEFSIKDIDSSRSVQEVYLADEYGLIRSYKRGTLVEAEGFSVQVRQGMSRESHSNLSMEPFNTRHFFENRIKLESDLIWAERADRRCLPPSSIDSVFLQGGADPSHIDVGYYTGYTPNGDYLVPSVNGYSTGVSVQRPYRGLALFEEAPEIDFVAIPDLINASKGDTKNGENVMIIGHRQVLMHCERVGYRFAILDLPIEIEIRDAERWRANFDLMHSQKYGAVYHPWLQVHPREEGGAMRWIPPSGHVAGVYSKTDTEISVAKAPANDRLYGVYKLRQEIDNE